KNGADNRAGKRGCGRGTPERIGLADLKKADDDEAGEDVKQHHRSDKEKLQREPWLEGCTQEDQRRATCHRHKGGGGNDHHIEKADERLKPVPGFIVRHLGAPDIERWQRYEPGAPDRYRGKVEELQPDHRVADARCRSSDRVARSAAATM